MTDHDIQPCVVLPVKYFEMILDLLVQKCYFIVVVQTSCTHLSISASGRIVPCNSGESGMHRTEDSCNFTCNTGFEMTGNDAGTCRQVSGNWSDNESPCKRGMQLTTIKC